MSYTIDLENTNTWVAGFNKSYKPSMFLRKNIFSGLENYLGDSVLMDYKKGSRNMAPFIVAGGNALVARDEFETKSYTPPLIEASRGLDGRRLQKRSFGENPLNPLSPEEKAAKIIAEDMKDLTSMIDRRIEWMCAQLLVNGSFTAKGYASDGKKQVVDTITLSGFTQKKTLSGTDLWSDKSADIYEQINKVGVDMRKNGNAPTMMIANSTTISYLLKNESLLKNKMIIPADNANFGTIKPQVVDNTVVRYAILMPGNLEVYGYDDCYKDDDGTVKPYIPDGYVVFTSQNVGKILAASITQLMEDNEFHTYTGLYIPKQWVERSGGNDQKFIRLASACVPMVADVDSFYTMKVL